MIEVEGSQMKDVLFSKIEKEFSELKVAVSGQSKLMQIIKLSHLCGAMEEFCKENGFSLSELIEFYHSIKNQENSNLVESNDKNCQKNVMDGEFKSIFMSSIRTSESRMYFPNITELQYQSHINFSFESLERIFEVQSGVVKILLSEINNSGGNELHCENEPLLIASDFGKMDIEEMSACCGDACLYYDHSFGLKNDQEQYVMILVSKIWLMVLKIAYRFTDDPIFQDKLHFDGLLIRVVHALTGESADSDTIIREFQAWQEAWEEAIEDHSFNF